MEDLPQLRVIPNFLSASDIQQWHDLLFGDEFWADGARFPGMVNYARPTMPPGYESLEADLTDRIALEVEKFFGFEMTTAVSPGFRKWTVGGVQGSHLDHGDFNQCGQVVIDYVQTPSRTWPRCLNQYASVLYWNEDFVGGDIYFSSAQDPTLINRVITPKTGMLIMFPCSEDYAHGVTEVLEGERIISTHFWTTAQTAAILASPVNVKHEALHRRYREKVQKRLSDGFFYGK